jgi:hypothetical protein
MRQVVFAILTILSGCKPAAAPAPIDPEAAEVSALYRKVLPKNPEPILAMEKALALQDAQLPGDSCRANHVLRRVRTYLSRAARLVCVVEALENPKSKFSLDGKEYIYTKGDDFQTLCENNSKAMIFEFKRDGTIPTAGTMQVRLADENDFFRANLTFRDAAMVAHVSQERDKSTSLVIKYVTNGATLIALSSAGKLNNADYDDSGIYKLAKDGGSLLYYVGERKVDGKAVPAVIKRQAFNAIGRVVAEPTSDRYKPGGVLHAAVNELPLRLTSAPSLSFTRVECPSGVVNVDVSADTLAKCNALAESYSAISCDSPNFIGGTAETGSPPTTDSYGALYP